MSVLRPHKGFQDILISTKKQSLKAAVLDLIQNNACPQIPLKLFKQAKNTKEIIFYCVGLLCDPEDICCNALVRTLVILTIFWVVIVIFKTSSVGAS
jgi:hypothetical protein